MFSQISLKGAELGTDVEHDDANVECSTLGSHAD
jgi:hypothetical protein